MKKIIEVNNLFVLYNKNIVCKNISFSINKNQIIGIIGPNGSGKSTLIKAILGLIPIHKGKIRILNKPIHKVRKKIAYIPQRNDINFDFPLLVEDIVMMGRYPHLKWFKYPSKKDKEIVTKSLKTVKLFNLRKKPLKELSGGEQQRLFLARTLASDPEIFFLDEPFVGIDITSENTIIDILKKLKKQGKTIFIIDHNLSSLSKYLDSIIMLKNKLIAYGDFNKVFNINNLKKVYSDKITKINNKELMVLNNE